MAAEISARTGGDGTASMPVAAVPAADGRTPAGIAPSEGESAQPEDEPAWPGAWTGGPTGRNAPPGMASGRPRDGTGRRAEASGQPADRSGHPGAAPGQTGPQPPRPPLPGDDELEAVKRYVLLGIAVRILDHDIRVVGSSKLKLPRFYESVLRGLQDRALLELAALRRLFRSSGIKVYEERKEAEGLTAAWVCRGYHHRFTMPWSFVRAEAERLLKRYAAPE